MSLLRRDLLKAGLAASASSLLGVSSSASALSDGREEARAAGPLERSRTDGSFYVATNGDDGNPGTLTKPFASLSRARDAVRELKRIQPDRDITVLIRGGTYALDRTVVFGLEDSGGTNQVITYAAYPGEEPVFSGGVEITGWRKLANPPEALPEAARGKVWVADVTSMEGRFHALFDADGLLPRARSHGFKPLRGYYKGEPFAEGMKDFWAMTFAPAGEKSLLYFPKGVLKNWSNLDDVEVRIFPQGPYTMNLLPLAWVDEEKGVAGTAIPATYPMNPVKWWVDPLTPEEGPLRQESAWVENILEALDKPGEWVLDTHEKKLYLWPRSDSPTNIMAPRLIELIRVEGQVFADSRADVPVTHLVFRGLTFTHGDRDVWTLQDASIQHDWEMYDKSTALVRFRGSEHCLIDECRFMQSGGTGVRFDLYSQYNRVQRSLFDHLGQSGILICGYGPGTKDVSHHNSIVNNHLHHLGEIYWDSHGIIVWQSGENLVANNLIHDMPRKAISVSGVRSMHFNPQFRDNRECSRLIRWDEVGAQGAQVDGVIDYVVPFLHVRNNVIEHNEIYRILGKGEDGGGINITGNAEGNIIRQNLLHDIHNPMADGAIRYDGNGHGTLIAENIIYDCALPAIHDEPGNDYIENNIMVDVSSRRRPEQSGYFIFDPKDRGRFQHNILYSSDKSAKFLLNLEGANLSQYATDFNIYYFAGNSSGSEAFLEGLRKGAQARKVGEGGKGASARPVPDEHSISADPLFVSVEKKDFRLKPDSPAFRLGFKPIDTNLIGLRDDFPAKYR